MRPRRASNGRMPSRSASAVAKPSAVASAPATAHGQPARSASSSGIVWSGCSEKATVPSASTAGSRASSAVAPLTWPDEAGRRARRGDLARPRRRSSASGTQSSAASAPAQALGCLVAAGEADLDPGGAGGRGQRAADAAGADDRERRHGRGLRRSACRSELPFQFSHRRYQTVGDGLGPGWSAALRPASTPLHEVQGRGDRRNSSRAGCRRARPRAGYDRHGCRSTSSAARLRRALRGAGRRPGPSRSTCRPAAPAGRPASLRPGAGCSLVKSARRQAPSGARATRELRAAHQGRLQGRAAGARARSAAAGR